MKMLKEVEAYWTRRAESYSDVVCHELNHSNEKSWMEVILKEIPEDKKIKIADMVKYLTELKVVKTNISR